MGELMEYADGASETKECIACSEEIKKQAKLCKHCGTLQDGSNFEKPERATSVLPQKKDRRGIGCGTIVLILLGIIFIGGIIGGDDSEDGSSTGSRNSSQSSSNSSNSSSSTSADSADEIETQGIQSDRDSISAIDCANIRTNIRTVRDMFSEGTANASLAGAVLQEAASEWRGIARDYNGSKSDWLNKMSELSLDLRSFILTGDPPNGGLIQDQLYNNFNLANQFCQ
jgi:hypothetical protein